MARKNKKSNAPQLSREEIYDEVDQHFEEDDLSFVPMSGALNKKKLAQAREFDLGSDSEQDDLALAQEQEERISSAWGKKKDAYYDQDSVDEEEDLELEEEEVKRLRMERIAAFDEEIYVQSKPAHPHCPKDYNQSGVCVFDPNPRMRQVNAHVGQERAGRRGRGSFELDCGRNWDLMVFPGYEKPNQSLYDCDHEHPWHPGYKLLIVIFWFSSHWIFVE